MELCKNQEQAVRELLLMAKVAESMHESCTNLLTNIMVRDYIPSEHDVLQIESIKRYVLQYKDDLVFKESVWSAALHKQNKK